MQYELYFGDFRLGSVVEEAQDFPRLWGRFVEGDEIRDPQTEVASRISRFLYLNRECMRLIDLEHERESTAELDELNRQLEEFTDLSESDKWRLVDCNGRVAPILCPFFRHGGGIVWGWSP